MYEDRCIKIKIETCSDKVYTNFHCLNMAEDGVDWEYFTVISIDSLLLYENKHYLLVYLDNYDYKVLDKKMTDYLGDSLFQTD